MKEKIISFWEYIKAQKRNLVLPVLSAVILLVVLFWAVKRVYIRYSYEKQNNSVEIAVNMEQMNEICGKENYNIENLLDRLKTIGVSSIVTEEETLDSLSTKNKLIYFQKSEVEKYKILGFVSPATVISPDSIIIKNQKLSNYLKKIIKEKTGKSLQETAAGPYMIYKITKDIRDIGWGYQQENADLAGKFGLSIILKPYRKSWIPEELPGNFSCLLLTDSFDDSLVDLLKGREVRVALEEFSKEEQKYNRILMPASEETVRLYRVFPEKLQVNKVSVSEAMEKSIKAARERNCRILYFSFLDGYSLEQNLDNLRVLCNQLKKNRFIFSQYSPAVFVQWGNLPDIFNKLFGLFIAVLFPVFSAYILKIACLRYGKEKTIKDTALMFFLICLVNIIGALLVTALFSDLKYFVKLDEFRGTKLLLLLPILFSVFIFFSYKELKEFYKRPSSLGEIFLLLIVLITAVLLIVRSGNISFVPSFETKIRFFLENSFGIRPRFKEFLIGHPALIIGIAFNSPAFMLIGLIGQVSIINTFIHFHTPLYISILRAVYGMVTGLLAGLAIVYALKSEFWKKLKAKL